MELVLLIVVLSNWLTYAHIVFTRISLSTFPTIHYIMEKSCGLLKDMGMGLKRRKELETTFQSASGLESQIPSTSVHSTRDYAYRLKILIFPATCSFLISG